MHYHPDRRPVISFACGRSIIRAEVDTFWADKLLVFCPEKHGLTPGDRLSKVHFQKYGRRIPVPDLVVTQIQRQGTAIRAVLVQPEPPQRETIAGLLAELESPRRSRADIPARLPFFGRKGHYSPEAVEGRRRWTTETTGGKIQALRQTILDPQSLAGNIENYIGAVQIPVGIVGPVRINGLYTRETVPVTAATTEGALIASMTRGAVTCNQAGGIQVHVLGQTMTRAPVFFCRDLSAALALERWVADHQAAIRRQAQSVSSVAKLRQIAPFVFGDNLHLRFHYSTADAAGQNMTTACTAMACRWIKWQAEQAGIGPLDYMIEGNLSGDKKVNLQNFTVGRGIAVTATCRIPARIMKARLGLGPEKFCRCWQAGETGALQSGMVGSNINFANAIAAIFAATGQDIASVHESACGIFKVRIQDDDLLCTVYLPGLVIGTVGGGTWLPCQRECLEIMGCRGEGKAFRLAEIIAATCLALDLSTGAAIASNRFARAHDQLGRSRKIRGPAFSQLNKAFFNSLLPREKGRVRRISSLELDTANAVLSTMVRRHNRRSIYGLHRYRLGLDKGDLDVVLKIKPHENRLLDLGVQVARMTGQDSLAGLFEANFGVFGLEGSHLREIRVIRELKNRLDAHLPAIYGTCSDEKRHLYAILMEDLSGCRFFSGDCRRDKLDDTTIGLCLEALAEIHAAFWPRQVRSAQTPAGVKPLQAACLTEAGHLLASLTEFNARRFGSLMPSRLPARMKDFLENATDYVTEMQHWGFTLTHNDCTPRNICISGAGENAAVLFYDWEFACLQNPEHDLAEFLAFTLPWDSPPARRKALLDHYYSHLARLLGRPVGPRPVNRLLALNALHLALVRINLYLLGHNVMPLDFIEPVLAGIATLSAGLEDRTGTKYG